ncbi:acetyltransferase [Chryseobacterium chendengshani]|uniref:acetyltransferase n=1 Tax=unclassified Chryseobacterium TaxID=2593645 RepID=UPI001C640652|nr:MULTISPECIES: acetyltransferase [unclassified Chryseobacterium]MBW7675601.1 acetyltransferase [Chryseobacterium sp. LJ756]MBW8521836.1 acetyltransferase [Chryseobacterium sp. LJ668]QYK17496.1 acetyltransferase [Chryseobacterium sp. LJ668]
MLIVGAKGFAKEVLEICHQNNEIDNLVFYDDVNDNSNGLLYGKFPILKSLEEARDYFEKIDTRFTIGIGNPKLRIKLFEKFMKLGGTFTSTISKDTESGSYGVEIGIGCNILSGVKISNDVIIGKGAIIYYNSIITHDVVIGEFVELSPGTTVLGRSKIGDFTQIGSGAIIFPDLVIGNNVVIGAGAVVTQSLPDNCVAVGIPAKIIKINE